MQKFFRSSFFILTLIALLSGICGAFLSGWFDLTPEPGAASALENFLGGVSYGVTPVLPGLIFYWVYHTWAETISLSWAQIENKARRVIWVICWAGFLGWALPSFLLPIVYIT